MVVGATVVVSAVGYAVAGGVYGAVYGCCGGTAPVVGAVVVAAAEEALADADTELDGALCVADGFTVNEGTDSGADGAQATAAPQAATTAAPARVRRSMVVLVITVNAICNIRSYSAAQCKPGHAGAVPTRSHRSPWKRSTTAAHRSTMNAARPDQIPARPQPSA